MRVCCFVVVMCICVCVLFCGCNVYSCVCVLFYGYNVHVCLCLCAFYPYVFLPFQGPLFFQIGTQLSVAYNICQNFHEFISPLCDLHLFIFYLYDAGSLRANNWCFTS